jgi:hypothetical protein
MKIQNLFGARTAAAFHREDATHYLGYKYVKQHEINEF